MTITLDASKKKSRFYRIWGSQVRFPTHPRSPFPHRGHDPVRSRTSRRLRLARPPTKGMQSSEKPDFEITKVLLHTPLFHPPRRKCPFLKSAAIHLSAAAASFFGLVLVSPDIQEGRNCNIPPSIFKVGIPLLFGTLGMATLVDRSFFFYYGWNGST